VDTLVGIHLRSIFTLPSQSFSLPLIHLHLFLSFSLSLSFAFLCYLFPLINSETVPLLYRSFELSPPPFTYRLHRVLLSLSHPDTDTLHNARPSGKKGSFALCMCVGSLLSSTWCGKPFLSLSLPLSPSLSLSLSQSDLNLCTSQSIPLLFLISWIEALLSASCSL